MYFMAWNENDDKEVTEHLDRLQQNQKKLQLISNPSEIIINNLRNIQTKTQFGAHTVVDNERIQQKIKINPKDKWGDEMTDEYRLQVKNECIVKTIELLGEPDE